MTPFASEVSEGGPCLRSYPWKNPRNYSNCGQTMSLLIYTQVSTHGKRGGRQMSSLSGEEVTIKSHNYSVHFLPLIQFKVVG